MSYSTVAHHVSSTTCACTCTCTCTCTHMSCACARTYYMHTMRCTKWYTCSCMCARRLHVCTAAPQTCNPCTSNSHTRHHHPTSGLPCCHLPTPQHSALHTAPAQPLLVPPGSVFSAAYMKPSTSFASFCFDSRRPVACRKKAIFCAGVISSSLTPRRNFSSPRQQIPHGDIFRFLCTKSNGNLSGFLDF